MGGETGPEDGAEVVRPVEASKHGLSRSTLHRRAEAGFYDRIGHGIYRSSNASPADFDLIEAATRRPDAIMCLTSALAQHDLIDDIPAAVDLAIPRRSRIPATHGAIKWHRFDTETFELGREDYPIAGTDLQIGIYTSERCIVDAFRLRGSLGYETGRDALRMWLAKGGQPGQLMSLARQIPRASQPLYDAIGHLA